MIASNIATVIAVAAFFVTASTESLEGQDARSNEIKITSELNEVGSGLMNHGLGWQQSVPGVPGRDYPNLSSIPETSFSCTEKTPGGYYADVETRCQVFHVCNTGNIKSSFLCPSGSIFNQKHLVCDWWYDFDCNNALDLYALNEILNNPEADAEPLTEQPDVNVKNQAQHQYYNGNALSESKDKGYSVSKNSDLSLASTGDARNSPYRRQNSFSDNKAGETNEKTFENLRLIESSTKFPSNSKGRINDGLRYTTPTNYVQSTRDSSHVTNYRSSSPSTVQQARHNFVENKNSNFQPFGNHDKHKASNFHHEQEKKLDHENRPVNITDKAQRNDGFEQPDYRTDENVTPQQYKPYESVTQVINHSNPPHEVGPFSTVIPYTTGGPENHDVRREEITNIYSHDTGSYSTSRPEIYVSRQNEINRSSHPPNAASYSTIRPENQVIPQEQKKQNIQSHNFKLFSTVRPHYNTLRKEVNVKHTSTTKQPHQIAQNSKTDNRGNRFNVLPRGFIKNEFTNKLQKSTDRQSDIAKYSGAFVNDGLVSHDFLKYNGYQNVNYDTNSYDAEIEGALKEFQFEGDEDEAKLVTEFISAIKDGRRNPVDTDVDRKRQWEVDSADLKRHGFDGDLSTSDSPSFKNAQSRSLDHLKYPESEVFDDYSDFGNNERFERRTLGTRPTGGLTKGLGNGFPGANRELAGSIAIAGKNMREEDFLKMEEQRREYLPPFGEKAPSKSK